MCAWAAQLTQIASARDLGITVELDAFTGDSTRCGAIRESITYFE
jgi:hypothetical protein